MSTGGRYSGKYCFELIRLKYTPCPEEFLVHHHKTGGSGSVFFDASDCVALHWGLLGPSQCLFGII